MEAYKLLSNYLEKKKHSYLFIYILLICYMTINTGLVSDDFAEIVSLKDSSLWTGINSFIERPALFFVIGFAYKLFGDNILLYDIAKVFYITVELLLIARFFTLWFRKEAALLAAFIFLYYPIHESTVFWFLNHWLPLAMAFYMYAFYLAEKERHVIAFFMACMASFLSYGSTPMALSLAVLFLMQKKIKKAFIMAVPNMIYIGYYTYLTVFMGKGIKKLPAILDAATIIKQFILQVATFADAAIGPSFWLKIYYALFELTPMSIVIGLISIALFYKTYKKGGSHHDKRLLASFSVLLVFSFMMFAVTGHYPQLAFNLGNRTTLYGSLLLTYLIALLPVRKVTATVIFGLMLFSILGISDHWKNWNRHQQQVMQNIKTNPQLAQLISNELVYVSGNQYSKLGKISHLEFFSESFAVSSVFKLSLGDKIQAVTINKRFRYADGYIIDTKYDDKYTVTDYINVYDSERNELFKVYAADINNYIASLPADNRHWVQLLDNNFLKNIAVTLMPRLKYAL